MKLKGREFPFWAVNVKGKGSRLEYECLRFFKKEHKYYRDDFYYNARISISGWTGLSPHWYSHQRYVSGGGGRLAVSTVHGYKELTVLPSTAKQMFIKEMFGLYK